jgi:fructose-1,6-bisphosphatase II
MEKLVVDREVAEALGPEALDAPPAWTLGLVARAKGKQVRDLVVFILDRPRHRSLIHDVRRAGARVYLRPAGDIGAAIMAADPRGDIDVMMGVGGASEGLLAACAVKVLGGGMFGRIAPQSDTERDSCEGAGIDLARTLSCDDMIAGEDIFFTATGITSTPLVHGVRYRGDYVDTQSIVLRADTGTRRIISTEHRLK